MRFAEQAAALVAEATAFRARAVALRAFRDRDGRSLSAAKRDELRAVAGSLEDVAAELRRLAAEPRSRDVAALLADLRNHGIAL